MAYYGNQPIAGETNSFKVLDDISSYTKTFDGSSAAVVSTSDDTLTFYDHRFIQGQRVTYGKGSGGTVVTGLTDATVYYVIRQDKDTIQLATSASNAAALTAVDLTGVGGGTVHELTVAFDGTNTKFKATTGGIHIKLTRPGQLMISMNGVIQEPQNNTPSNGFGIESNNVIVFSTAPTVLDTFWGHYLTSNLSSWEMSDNKIDNFTGNGSTTTYTLSKTPANADNILVTIDGVTQYPSDSATTRAYTLNASVVTFTTAPTINAAIAVRHIGYAGGSGGGSGGGGVTGFYGRTGNVSVIRSDLQNTDINLKNLTGVAATFTGNVSIGGTLTYTDVTNIDSIGIVTAQSGVHFGIGATSGKFEAATGITTFSTSVGIADSIHHVGNTDTSIRFPADDIFTVETAGKERLRIKSDGNVEVSTTTDTNPRYLRFNSDRSNADDALGGITGVWNGNSVAGITFKAGADTGNKDDGRIQFITYGGGSTSTRMMIREDGKVGINTEIPSSKLTLAAASGNTIFELKRSNTNTTGAVGVLNFTALDGHSVANIQVRGDGNDEGGAIQFRTTSAAASNDPYASPHDGLIAMQIKSDGQTVLDGSNSQNVNYPLQINNSAAAGNGTNPDVTAIAFASGASTKASIQAAVYGEGWMSFHNNDNSEKMRLLANGNLGIGTQIPANTLDVIGGNIRVGKTSNGQFIGENNSGSVKIKLDTDGDSYLNGGNIGINRSNPDQRLNVSGNIEVNAYEDSNGQNGYKTATGFIIGNAYDAGKTGLTDDRNAIIWQERGLDVDFGVSDSFVMKLHHQGNVGINTTLAGSQTWRNGKRLEIFGGEGNVTGELHLGAIRSDANQSVGSINFFDNGQDTSHKHIALIEADKAGSTSNKRGGDLLFFTKKDNVAAPDEKLRITSKGTTIAYHGNAPSDALTYPSAFRSREGVIGPIYYWPRSYGNHSNGGGYDNVAEGGRLTLRMVGAQGGTAAMFHGGFGVTFGGGGEGIEYNRVRVIFRVTRDGTSEGYEQDQITFKMQQYYYSGGWTDISGSSWNFTGMDSERGYRWTASNWISSADFAGGFDVPSMAIKYDTDNGNASNHNVRIAAVYLQYARFN